MAHRADVIVLGLGALGSAMLYQLAKRGVDVLGIDRYSPPHHFGSTHGDTRVTRLAIGEGREFVPLAMRSHELWRELEAETGTELLEQCGGLIFGAAQDDTPRHGVANFLQSTIDTANEFGIRHELLDHRQLHERYPQFKIDGTETAYFEYDAGYVRPEDCVAAHLQSAESNGARISRETIVRSIQRCGNSFRLVCDDDEFETDQLIVSAGAWVGDLLGSQLAPTFSVYRQIMSWFEPREQPQQFSKEKSPIFIWVTEDSDDFLYGFPETDPSSGVKVATERYDDVIHPDTRQLEVTDDEKAWMTDFVQRRIPSLGPCVKAVSCLYTCTPDYSFVIDRHPEWDNCQIVSACSGHAFKHSAAIGEAVAERITTGECRIDLSSFSLNRFC